MPIQTVLFDFIGTLARFVPEQAALLAQAAARPVGGGRLVAAADGPVLVESTIGSAGAPRMAIAPCSPLPGERELDY